MTDYAPDSFALRSGFPWWLPLLTAAIAVLIAVIVSQSTASAWDADVHLWSSDGRPASDYAALLLDPELRESASGGLMASEHGTPQIDDVAVAVDGTLIRLTVRAEYESDAELLALSLGRAAIDEAHARFDGDSGLDLLGLVQPGARKVAPLTERSAAWASAVGLGAGLALAWAVAARSRRTSVPPSALGRLGRCGLKPLAVLNADVDHAPSLTAALQPLTGVVAFTSLDAAPGVASQVMHTASRLAAAGKTVLWLDARRPAFELGYAPSPSRLQGPFWMPLTRREQVQRAAEQSASDASAAGCVLLLIDDLNDPDTSAVTEFSDHVILLASVDSDDDAFATARRRLRGTALRGVVLTDADQTDQLDFELAQVSD